MGMIAGIGDAREGRRGTYVRRQLREKRVDNSNPYGKMGLDGKEETMGECECTECGKVSCDGACDLSLLGLALDLVELIKGDPACVPPWMSKEECILDAIATLAEIAEIRRQR